MNHILNSVEIRILASLIEKHITTPEYYPLTLNALANACNQKNNRHPVVSLDETVVAGGLDSLREKKLVSMVTGSGLRVPKYKQSFTEALNLNPPEIAVLCLLMLRGPQTVGEIRSRTGPLHNFTGLVEVEAILESLASGKEREPCIRKLPRQAGQKEARYMHLFSGEPDTDEHHTTARPEAATPQSRAVSERLTTLEQELKSVKEEIGTLRQMILDFKKQFE